MNSATSSSSFPSLVAFDMESVCDNPKSVVADGGDKFEGKVLVITGAGGQFGREGCLFFARRGVRIAALDQDKAGLKGTFEAMETELGEDFDFMSYVCDVTNAEQIHDVVNQIILRFRRIDLLWNNAGYQGKIEPTLTYDPDDFARVMNINVTGMFIVMQACARQMEKQADGASYAIVNTSSVAALRGTPAMIAYASSKAAVLAMTISAAKDLAHYGIRVNAVSPALIGPGMMWDRQNRLQAISGSPYYSTDPEQVARDKVNSVPMKRLGTIEEVIKPVAFLLGESSSYCTGTNVVVDGGFAAGLRA